MQKRATSLSFGARLYIATVVAVGTYVIGDSAYDLIVYPTGNEWLWLAGLTILTGSFSIKLPSVSARISVCEAFVFAAVLSFGPAPATVIVALDTIILTSWSHGGERPRVRAIFNVSAGATAIWVGAHVFRLLLPVTPASPRLEELLIPVSLLAATYFAVNSSLIAIAVAYEKALPAIEIWKNNFVWVGLNYVGGACVAMLLVT